MKCRRIQNLLSAYLDEELDPPKRRAVETHLTGCPQCRTLLEQIRGTARLLGNLPRERAPEDLADSIREAAERMALLGETLADEADLSTDASFGETSTRERRRNLAPWSRGLAAAAVVLAAVGLGVVIGQFTGPRDSETAPPGSRDVAEVPPKPGNAPAPARRLGKDGFFEDGGVGAKLDARPVPTGRAEGMPQDVPLAGASEGGEVTGQVTVDKKRFDAVKKLGGRDRYAGKGAADDDRAQYFFLDVADRPAAVRLLRKLVELADGKKAEVRTRFGGTGGQAAKGKDWRGGVVTAAGREAFDTRAALGEQLCVVQLSEGRVASFLGVLDETVGLQLARAEEELLKRQKKDVSVMAELAAADYDDVDGAGAAAGAQPTPRAPKFSAPSAPRAAAPLPEPAAAVPTGEPMADGRGQAPGGPAGRRPAPPKAALSPADEQQKIRPAIAPGPPAPAPPLPPRGGHGIPAGPAPPEAEAMTADQPALGTDTVTRQAETRPAAGGRIGRPPIPGTAPVQTDAEPPAGGPTDPVDGTRQTVTGALAGVPGESPTTRPAAAKLAQFRKEKAEQRDALYEGASAPPRTVRLIFILRTPPPTPTTRP